MFPFQVSSSYFDPENSISEMSTSSSTNASTCSDSDSSIATTLSSYDSTVSSNVKCQQVLMTASSSLSGYQPAMSILPWKPVHKPPTCFFEPSTCQYQSFSIPEKIVYYIARNVTNAETFQKLVVTCKYFYNVNPVIVVRQLECYARKWYACYGVNGEYRVEFKYDQPKNFKIWITDQFSSFFGNASQLIPFIYKNDATVVSLRGQTLKFEELSFLAGNAKELVMWSQLVKFKNGEIVQLEDIVKNLPKCASLKYEFDGSGVNCNTVRKLMDIEHFKNISRLDLVHVSEDLDVEGMFNYIIENRQVSVNLCYRRDISDAYKQLVQQYSNLLEKENVCNSRIVFYGINYGFINELLTSSSEDDSIDTSFYTIDDDIASGDDENEDLLFPWNNEEDEEWELPWDVNE